MSSSSKEEEETEEKAEEAVEEDKNRASVLAQAALGNEAIEDANRASMIEKIAGYAVDIWKTIRDTS